MNQQELSQAPSNSGYGETSFSSSNKSVFNLSQNTIKDEKDTISQSCFPSVNGGNIRSATNGNGSQQTGLKNTPIVFSPKKFVPSEARTNWKSEVVSEQDQTSTNDKIKPKWSPGPTNSKQEPKYKKIKPIFEKPKSPHRIT